LQIKNIIDTLTKHKAKTYKTRSTDKIKYIIVHHSATVQGSAESFANYHVKNNGWPGIGYHFVITKKGEIYQTNHIKTISYHATGYNTNGIGICMVGNFDIENPSKEQYSALVGLINYLKDQYDIEVKNVLGHRETPNAHKSCPGIKFDMDKLRGEL